jgi:hypothetical protein
VRAVYLAKPESVRVTTKDAKDHEENDEGITLVVATAS